MNTSSNDEAMLSSCCRLARETTPTAMILVRVLVRRLAAAAAGSNPVVASLSVKMTRTRGTSRRPAELIGVIPLLGVAIVLSTSSSAVDRSVAPPEYGVSRIAARTLAADVYSSNPQWITGDEENVAKLTRVPVPLTPTKKRARLPAKGRTVLLKVPGVPPSDGSSIL